MELLIPGLILVALMVYASTKIKKRAAAAFEPEFIETDTYTLEKPEGFLHVIGDPGHEFIAYSKEFGVGDDARHRQATIEIDVFSNDDLETVCEAISASADSHDVRSRSETTCIIETDETANETTVKGLYKVVATQTAVYRLRFSALAKHADDHLRRMNETVASFTVKTN